LDTVYESPLTRPKEDLVRQPVASNAELISAIRARDRKATALFVADYADGLYAYLHRRLAPRIELAEDLLHEVFVTAFESIDNLREPSALRSWLYGIARHKVEDHYRKVLRDAIPSNDTEAVASAVEADFEQLLDDERLVQKIRHVMAELEEDYRTVLRWRYWEQRSTREMAAQLDRTVKAIERLLARARIQFKRRWNEEA